MPSSISTDPDDLRLGSVLQKLDLLDDNNLEFALTIALRTAMPLGTVLLANGLISRDELRLAIQAQSMLKDKLVEQDQLSLALPYLKGQPLGLEGALKTVKWHRDRSHESNRLGELLLSAKVLTNLQLAKALAHQRNSMQPLGQTLALLGVISRRALQYALSIQEKIRTGTISRKEGVQMLRTCRTAAGAVHFNRPKSEAHRLTEPHQRLTRIGDLLIESGMLEETDVREAMELSRREMRPVGEIFIELGMLDAEQMRAALDVQKLLRVGLIAKAQGVKALASMDASSNVVLALENGLTEEASKRHGVAEMLTVVTALTAKINERLRLIIERLYVDILNGVFEFEQAMLILSICIKDDCSIPEAAAKTGWTINVQPASRASIETTAGESIGWLTA